MSEERGYVRVDEHGVMRIGNSRVMLESIVAGFEQSHSPETLQQQYPALSLEEVYGAITYYLAHPDEVDAYLKRQDELWGAWRAKSVTRSSPGVEHLRALRASEALMCSSIIRWEPCVLPRSLHAGPRRAAHLSRTGAVDP